MIFLAVVLNFRVEKSNFVDQRSYSFGRKLYDTAFDQKRLVALFDVLGI